MQTTIEISMYPLREEYEPAILDIIAFLNENKDVLVNVGRFGPYVKWGDDFISLPKGTDLGTIDFIKAVEYIKAKQKADAPVGTFQEKPITKHSRNAWYFKPLKKTQ